MIQSPYRKMLRLIQENDARGIKPSLLLHCCCAPCTSGVLPQLLGHFDITLLYYNPNISPREEVEKRYNELLRYVSMVEVDVKVIGELCDEEIFFERVKGKEKEKEGGLRCLDCFELRLKKTAELASSLGFEYFATTLTVSPLKNPDIINAIGERVKGSVKYLASDFKKGNGYLNSVNESKRLGLYRQTYCGCIFSEQNK